MGQENSKNQFLLGLFGGIAVVAVIGLIILGVAFINVSKDNGKIAGEAEQNNQNLPNNGQGNTGPVAKQPAVEGAITFSEKEGAEICREDGKPVIYLFSTTWCPHCQWISETFNNTVKKYVEADQIVAYHWEIDINDDVLTAQKETQVPAKHSAVYQEFNPGGSIPTFVFGCKYYRVGNGYESQNDLNAEVAEFEALINDLIK